MLNRLVSEVRAFTEDQLDHIRRLTQIGAALSAEKNLDRLLEMIVDEARKFTHASGGTLYIMSDDETELHFAIVQNDSLNVRMGGTGDRITWPPVKLRNEDGTENHTNVSAHAAISGEVVNIPDVYNAEGFNFEGTRRFDAQTGYRSRSMLVVPMRNHENDIIGVLQLLNAQDPSTNEVITFSRESEKMTESLASQAAVALSNNRLIEGLENLLESFITSIATVVDEKSPYTGGHVRRVAELTMAIARKINGVREGPLADFNFNEEQLRELRTAAWLHDVGKITTPEHVVDKATKLETICDRIELLKARFEILKRDYEIEQLKRRLEEQGGEPSGCSAEGQDAFVEAVKDDLEFLINANMGGEFMADEKIERLKTISERMLQLNGQLQPLILKDEVYNLSIRRGTLNREERDIINNHAAVTHKILSQLPFPKKLRNVAQFAAAHHEKLDGTGYPLGLDDSRLPIQSRILALADVFEALTAKDRPYKKGKTLSEAMKIMAMMVKDRHIDADLFDLFLKEKIYLDYARRELSAQQIDQTEF
ncbi:MAG: GAF domain-containing protein [Deltaproteobacteria bacterium]|nr:GAF domain-containing protein [Deltaproteobacteria bacterium]